MKKILLLTSLLPLSFLFGATETWNLDANGNWGTAGNWTPASVPNAQDEAVIIGSPALTAARTITQDVATTVNLGTMTLQSPTAFGYLISGTNSLTWNVSSGNASLTVPIAPANIASHTISLPLVLTSSLVVNNANATQSVTLNGGSSGGGSFTNASTGAGLVILGGTNTFTGGFINTSGTTQCSSSNTLPPTGTVTMNGGTLSLNGNGQIIGGLAGTAPISLGAATLTVNTSAANVYSGVMSGGGGLTVTGTGSLKLNTAQAYTGLTTVTGGTLQLGINNALPAGGAVNLTGGTLDLNNFNQSVGNLSATGGNITLGTGELSISLSAGQNFAGVISGTGPVTFNGNGFIWTLGAAQTYTGLTTINSGTIRLGIANGLPSGGAVTLAGTGIFDLNNFSQTVGTLTSAVGTQILLGSGQLTVQPTADTNFAGVVSGTGSVIYQGPSIWTMQTAQTYTGGTTINGGTLRMGVANGLAPTGAVTINTPGILDLNNNPLAIASLAGNGNAALGSGALTLNTTATTIYSGVISGTGSLTVAGSGKQILLGPNTYSGGTTVSNTATLEGTTTSLQGAIANNSILFFNQPFNGTYAGPLSGTGELRVGGGGTLTLTGTPTQGSATILGGELDIASGSTFTATTVTVNGPGIIGGSGTYAANISNFGTINPAGTLTVTGNVTFQPGSFFIADLTPTNSDHLNVSGTVSIDPNATVIAKVLPGHYNVNNIFTIISAGNPVMGQFQHAVVANPFFQVDFLYNQVPPGSVQVNLNIRNFSEVIQGGNAGAISTCITQENMIANADLENLVSDIIFFPVQEVRGILNEMQPSQLRGLTLAEQENALFAQATLSSRMAEFYKSTCEREISQSHPLNFWFNFAGMNNEERSHHHNVGFRAPTATFTMGLDGKISHNLFIGLGLEYGYTWLHYKENQGSSRINRGSIGPYVVYAGKWLYANFSTLGSIAHFDTSRHIPFFDETAKSRHHSKSLLPHLEAGILFRPAPRVTLSPFASADYIWGWENGFSEKGAQVLNFKIDSSKSHMLRTEAGVRISKCAIRSHSKWVHDLKASWVREMRFEGKHLKATFEEFPCSFTVSGLYPTRNLLDIGMGLAYLFKHDRFTATLRYEGLFGQGVTMQSGTAQLSTRF